jgi:5-(carboxyamino)imidazole ribonucleotide synthase
MSLEKSIGILGAGQLGAMLIASAVKFGLKVSILDNSANAPGSRYTSVFQSGDPMNYFDVVAFGIDKDIITIEKESVNTDALKWLKAQGVKVYPDPEIIEVIQNKYLQKQFLSHHNIPVVNGKLVHNKQDIQQAIAKYPVCLKLCKGGYDGKGVMILKDESDIINAFDAPCVVEDVVDIKKEISIIIARNKSGMTKYYQPVEMYYNKDKYILDYQVCPAEISEEVYQSIIDIANNVAEATKLVGILAIEMFIDGNDKIWVNELAPRPHNSGHHTIETANTSQFEQLLRAVLDLPLGDSSMKSSSVMVNIVSNEKLSVNHATVMNDLLLMDHVYTHWYGKPTDRNGRKVGHITIEDTDIKSAINKAKYIKTIIQ